MREMESNGNRPTSSSASRFRAARRSRSSTSRGRAGRGASRCPRIPRCRARSRISTSAPTATRSWSTPCSGKRPAGALGGPAPLPELRVDREGVFDQDTVERFDEELDRGTEALVRDLKRLMRANMEDEIERFVGALAADAILPEDF